MIPVKTWDMNPLVYYCCNKLCRALEYCCCAGLNSHSFFSFLQLIRWTPEVAVCRPVCFWIGGERWNATFFLMVFVYQPAKRLLLYSSRRKKAVWPVWHPLEERRSRRRKFSSVLWVPRAWASAYPVVQPKNLVYISVTSSQAPSLQKLGLRWFFSKRLQRSY